MFYGSQDVKRRRRKKVEYPANSMRVRACKVIIYRSNTSSLTYSTCKRCVKLSGVEQVDMRVSV
uniref:Uncharacterized protein n=1 Tax=Anopheles atroparvus TaxID=41427 RepID=A0AAG5DQ85_ANOAO